MSAVTHIQASRNRGGRGCWGLHPPQIFAKADLLLIDSDSEKKQIVTKCKLVQIPLHIMHKTNFY